MEETEATIDKQSKISDYSDLHTRAVREFSEKYWQNAFENFNFRRGEHWSEQEKAEHTKQGRIHYSIPLAESKFAVIESQQMQTPYDIIAVPRTIDDEVNAEIKNAIFKYISDVNDLRFLFSEWYRDGLIKCYGVLEREIDTSEDIEGEIKVSKVLYDYFMWDTNCKQYNISRYANWCQKYGYMTRDELKDKYPDKKELVDSLPEQGDYLSDGNQNNRYTSWYRDDNGQELVKVIWHYQRRYKKYFKVTLNSGEVQETDERPEITEKPACDREFDFLNGLTYPVDYIERTREYIDVTLFTKDMEEELDSWEIDSNLMPFHVYFSNFDDGVFWTLMDLAKDPQRFLDRLTSQIDASMGKTIKNSYEIEWELIHPEDKNKWQKIQDDLVQGGGLIRTQGAAGRYAIKPINSGITPPELFSTWQFMVTVLEDILGGRSMQGLTVRNAPDQSGIAIERLQEAGFMMAYLYMYNLNRSIKSLGEGLNEDINTIYGNSVDKVIEITDDRLDELVLQKFKAEGLYEESGLRRGKGYLKINRSGSSGKSLGEAKTRIIIEKGDYSPTEKDRKLKQWFTINDLRIRSGEAPYPTSIFADNFSFDASMREKMIEFEQKQDEIAGQQREIERQKLLFEGISKQMENVKMGYDTIVKEEEASSKPANDSESGSLLQGSSPGFSPGTAGEIDETKDIL